MNLRTIGLAFAVLAAALAGCASNKSIPVTSNPEGATVYVAGRRIGTTPITVTMDDLLPNRAYDGRFSSSVRMTVKKEGYIDWQIVLEEWSVPNLIQAALAPAVSVPAPSVRTPLPAPTPSANRPSPRIARTGTGVRVAQDGYYVTNEHVVAGCAEVTVSGSRVRVVSEDAKNDLAILQGPAGVAAKLRAGAPIRLAEPVTAIGYPLRGLVGEGLQATTGAISGLSGLRNDSRFLQISAPVNSGNSGGPLVDSSGNVVGIVTGKLNDLAVADATGSLPQNVNFALKTSVVQNFLDTHGVRYQTLPSSKKMESADVVEQARSYTVLVSCWK